MTKKTIVVATCRAGKPVTAGDVMKNIEDGVRGGECMAIALNTGVKAARRAVERVAQAGLLRREGRWYVPTLRPSRLKAAKIPTIAKMHDRPIIKVGELGYLKPREDITALASVQLSMMMFLLQGGGFFDVQAYVKAKGLKQHFSETP